ncbi:hypothetical protein [Nosocomiicoccus massiliensis]|uniref:hypothetical protein n=1 Tax=Nosocomiicoccus massiliensis TaxID=1232430 RepID=UPI0003FECA27|nr:hypothetical protein [Nosocomiicoccus massiliensis]
MKKILLIGVYGEIGRNLYDTLKDTYELYAFMSKKDTETLDKIHPVYLNPYKLEHMVEAVKGMDLIIFFEDPIMRFSKITQGRFDTFFELIADNVGRAAEYNSVKDIIYISEEILHEDVKRTLTSYDVNVITTDTRVKRLGKSLKYNNSHNKTMRSAQRAEIPRGWTLEGVMKYYFKWLDEIIFGMFKIDYVDDEIHMTIETSRTPLLTLRRRKDTPERQIVFDVVGGRLAKKSDSWLEFRELKHEKSFIMALHDFDPALPWPIYAITQAQLHGLVSRIYQMEMIINDTIIEENIKNNPE